MLVAPNQKLIVMLTSSNVGHAKKKHTLAMEIELSFYVKLV